MKITIVGTGYVGLVTGTCLADIGNEVTCVDVDEKKIFDLQNGVCPIYEPGLEERIKRCRIDGRLRSFAAKDFSSAASADFVFLCVGTPQNDSTGEANLGYLFAAAEEVAKEVRDSGGAPIIVIKSTVPVGTHREVSERISHVLGHPLPVISNPEFLKEGHAVEDFMKPERIVIGSRDAAARAELRKLYEPLLRNVGRVFETDNATAELSKYATNAMLATRISFMNEMALLCDKAGGNVDDVRQILGADSRIGPKFLFPGPGFGGSCFGKDLQALIHTGRSHNGLLLEVAEAAYRRNIMMRRSVLNKICSKLESPGKGPIGVWGLAFKPGTDDIRDSPACWVIERLVTKGYLVTAYDPKARFDLDFHNYNQVSSALSAVQQCQALVLFTEWNEFKMPPWEDVRRAMHGSTIFDLRNLWDPAEVKSYGFDYIGMGRGHLER